MKAATDIGDITEKEIEAGLENTRKELEDRKSVV